MNNYTKWFGNARFLAFISATSANAALLKKRSVDTSVLDLDKLIASKSPSNGNDRNTVLVKQNRSYGDTWKCSPLYGETSPSAGSSCFSSTQSTQDHSKLRIFEGSSIKLTTRPSDPITNKNLLSRTEELEKFLRKELSSLEHPVNDLIHIFRFTYESIFSKKKISVDHLSSLTEQEKRKVIDEALAPVKMMLQILRKFTLLIYEGLVAVYHDDLKDEDQSADMIIDRLICQLMFEDVQSPLYQHIMNCLEAKCSEQIQYFNHVAELFRGKSLRQFDSQFKEAYSSIPYETVIKTVQRLQLIPNPYMKRDYITLLEQEMVCAIKDELTKKGQRAEIQLEPDDKFTIYTYCLVQGNYPKVVVDLSFIEEFALPDEANQAYARFKGCLMDYILSPDFLNFMKIEEELTLKAVRRESNLSPALSARKINRLC